MMFVGPRGSKESVIPYQIFCFGVACEFQGSVRIFLSINGLSGTRHSIGKGDVLQTSTVIGGMNRPNDDFARDSIDKHTVLVPSVAIAIKGIGHVQWIEEGWVQLI